MSIVLKEVSLKERDFGPVSVSFGRGELILLCGQSGSGKTTLCSLLCHRLETSSGSLERGEGTKLGFIAHDFQNQLIGSTVGEELQIVAEGEHLSPEFITILDSLEARLLALKAEEDPHNVGTAEQQTLLLCSLIRSGSRFLVLDESLSHLDPVALETLLLALKGLAGFGVSFLLVSHQERLLSHVDRVVQLVAGKVHYDGPPCQFSASERELSGFRPLIDLQPVEGLSSSVGPTIVGDGGIELSFWSTLAIGGLAGSGKTKLLGSLFGLESWKNWKLVGSHVTKCLLRQDVGPSFWRSSVLEEWQASYSAFRELPCEFGRLLKESVPDGWQGKRPDQLSHGQLRFFATICLLAQYPEILFLDAPFRGLDGALRNSLSRCFESYLQLGGRIIFTTHDAEVVRRLAQSVVWLKDGEVKSATRVGDWCPEEEDGIQSQPRS